MAADAALLTSVPFFQYLDDEEREVLAQQLDEVRIAAGELVFSVDDPGGTMFVIREGRVEVFFKDDTGERIVLETPGAGRVLRRALLIDGGAAHRLGPGDRGSRGGGGRPRRPRGSLRRTRRRRSTSLRRRASGCAVPSSCCATPRPATSTTRWRTRRTTVRRRPTGSPSSAAASRSSSALRHVRALDRAQHELAAGRTPRRLRSLPLRAPHHVVSLEAIILSVFVLLSQNRQVARDRIRNDIEYRRQPEGGAGDRPPAREDRRDERRGPAAAGRAAPARHPPPPARPNAPGSCFVDSSDASDQPEGARLTETGPRRRIVE